MAANKIIRLGPVALGTSVANIVNPPTITGGIGLSGTNTSTYLILRHIRIVNVTGSAAAATMYIGASAASAAGTEFMGIGLSVPANSYVDWFGSVRLDATEYLTGKSNTASALTFEAEGEIGIA